LSSRERIRLTFKHQEPDRVPFFEQGIASRLASDILGRPALTGGGAFRFQAALAAYRGPDEWAHFQDRYLKDYADLVEALDLDMVSPPWAPGGRASRRLDERSFYFEDAASDTWSVCRFDEATDTFQQVDSAFRHEGLAAIERSVRVLAREQAQQAREREAPPSEGDRVLTFLVEKLGGRSSPANPRAVASGVGLSIPLEEPWLEASLLRPELIDEYLDLQLEAGLTEIDRLAHAGVDVIWGGYDLAANKGPVYSPATFRRFILPRLQELTERAHRHSLPYVFRSDGWLWPIARELFVESGVDGYGEIDLQAGMSIAELKDRFPHLTLWGGVDCAGALVSGTPAEVAEETRLALAVGAPGGGFILGSSNVIHAQVKTENFLEMVRTFQQYSHY
jgi:uroporphyrinogen decarboxylase